MLDKRGVFTVGFFLFPVMILLILSTAVQGVNPEANAPKASVSASEEPTIWLDSVEVHTTGNFRVNVNFSNVPPTGGFDLLLRYLEDGINFVSVEAIGTVADWELLNYQYYREDTCGNGCMVGFIRLLGIADMPNPEDPGDVYNPEGASMRLTFNMTGDRSYIDMCWNLEWVWYHCNNNYIASVDGMTVFMAWDIEDILPDYDCLNLPGHNNSPSLHFADGQICNRAYSYLGDINLNGVAYEVSDAVLFVNYFLFGPAVWDPVYYQNQIFATDVNANGFNLEVADLVYLIRIIKGEVDP